MFEAMKDQDFQVARQHVRDLKEWLGKGGFYPPNYSKTEVDAFFLHCYFWKSR